VGAVEAVAADGMVADGKVSATTKQVLEGFGTMPTLTTFRWSRLFYALAFTQILSESYQSRRLVPLEMDVQHDRNPPS
jgi:hypothetical protein